MCVKDYECVFKTECLCLSSLQILCVYTKNHHIVFHILKWTLWRGRFCLAASGNLTPPTSLVCIVHLTVYLCSLHRCPSNGRQQADCSGRNGHRPIIQTHTHILKPVQAFKWLSQGLTDCSWPLIELYTIPLSIFFFALLCNPLSFFLFYFLCSFFHLLILLFNWFFLSLTLKSYRLAHSMYALLQVQTSVPWCVGLSHQLEGAERCSVSPSSPALHFGVERGKIVVNCSTLELACMRHLKDSFRNLVDILSVKCILSYTHWL